MELFLLFLIVILLLGGAFGPHLILLLAVLVFLYLLFVRAGGRRGV